MLDILNNSATFVEMLDIFVKIVPPKMPLATFVKWLAIILKCVKTSWKPQYRCNKDSSDPRAEISYSFRF